VASGTEATLMALRLARIVTGRRRLLKFAGHFHGWHDFVIPGADPPYDGRPVPGVPEEVARRVCAAVAALRREELYKLPGVGETITWARALLALDGHADLESTLGVALKVREDIDRVLELGVLRGA
jgi:hypothetical protein